MHIHTDPWTLVNGISRNMDRLLSTVAAERNRPGREAWVPPVDVREYEDRFEIVADIPGVSREQLDITLDDGVLVIAGERVAAAADETGTLQRSERTHGTFRRTFRLPESAAEEGLSAACNNGVLTVTIPKKPQPAPRRIEVRAN